MKRELRLRRNLKKLREIIKSFDMRGPTNSAQKYSSSPFKHFRSKTSHAGQLGIPTNSKGFGRLGPLKQLFSSPNFCVPGPSSSQKKFGHLRGFGTMDLSEKLRRMNVISEQGENRVGMGVNGRNSELENTRNLSRVVLQMKRAGQNMKKASSLFLPNKSSELENPANQAKPQKIKTVPVLESRETNTFLAKTLEPEMRKYYLPIGKKITPNSGKRVAEFKNSGNLLGHSGNFSMISNSKSKSLETKKQPISRNLANAEIAEKKFLSEFMKESLRFHVKENVQFGENWD